MVRFVNVTDVYWPAWTFNTKFRWISGMNVLLHGEFLPKFSWYAARVYSVYQCYQSKCRFLYGHVSHVQNLQLMEEACNNVMTKIRFPSFTTHKLRLVDISYVQPVVLDGLFYTLQFPSAFNPLALVLCASAWDVITGFWPWADLSKNSHH